MPKGQYVRSREQINNLINRNKSKKQKELVSKKLKGRPLHKNTILGLKKFQSTEEYRIWKSNIFKGKNNPQWMGNKVSYRAIHMWMQNNFGKANLCEGKNCKKITQYYEWANISGKYKRNRNDWIKLCKSCHMLMDYARRRK